MWMCVGEVWESLFLLVEEVEHGDGKSWYGDESIALIKKGGVNIQNYQLFLPSLGPQDFDG